MTKINYGILIQKKTYSNKKDKLLIHMKAWMNCTNIMICERSQIKRIYTIKVYFLNNVYEQAKQA